jgi:hypothetical protein
MDIRSKIDEACVRVDLVTAQFRFILSKTTPLCEEKDSGFSNTYTRCRLTDTFLSGLFVGYINAVRSDDGLNSGRLSR